MDSREFLDTFKKEFDLKSDSDIAHKIGTSKNNLNKWIQRNSIPDKWIIIMRQMSKDTQSTNKNENLYYFKKLHSKASAGLGEESFENGNDIFPISKKLFKHEIDENLYKIVEVIGDSMQPTIKDGDYAIIKEKHAFNGDGLYVIRKGNELFVKRVIKNLDGSCTIKSDNPTYPDILISKDTDENHYIIGKVKAILPQIEE